MKSAIDHLVFGAIDLAQGAEYIQDTLGIAIPSGGVHDKMGTHNLLMRLSDRTFLEVIAINPDGPAPDRPRWFGLDDPHVRRAMHTEPLLLTWVANTTDINTAINTAPFYFGRPETISRGKLSWLFGLPEDGHLLAGGLLPYLIEWPDNTHPAGSMPDRGCSLQKLCLNHANPTWLKTILKSIGLDKQVQVNSLPPNQAPMIEVTLRTPVGIRTLHSLST